MDKIIRKINSSKYVIDEDDAKRIIGIYTKWKDIEPYINDVSYKSDSIYPGCYDLKTRSIIFNDNKIIYYAYQLYDTTNDFYNVMNEYYNYYLNFYYLYIIGHEIAHALEEKRYEQSLDDELYQYIYELCVKLRKNKDFYNKYHDLFPMEKDSIIEGNKFACRIMSHTNIPLRELNILKLMCLRRETLYYIQGKDTIISPIKSLLKVAGISNKDYKELLMRSNLSMEERIQFGLDITLDEYNIINEQKTKLLSRINSKI